MKTIRIAQMVSVFFTGLFTGLMLTFMIVIQRMLATLSPSAYTGTMQELIKAADHPPIVPAIVIISLVAPLVVLIRLRHHTSSPLFRLTLAGLLVFALGAFFVTVGLNVPINTAIMSWSRQSPPPDWRQAQDHWNQLNAIRTPASGLSFLLHLIALTYPLPQDVR